MKPTKKDYEQLYYDELYKNKEMKQKLQLYEELIKENNIKKIIVTMYLKYKNIDTNKKI